MNKQKKFNQQNSKPILEELEERRLFSGGIEGLIVTGLDSDEHALYADADANKAQTADTNNDTSASAAEQQSQEIVFVDAGVDNHQQLVDDLLANSDSSRNIEVVVLDSDQDGIEQISAVLQDRDDLDAVHIISHGSDGNIELGNTNLNSETLQDNNLSIALWANAFAETGDILIYGCNLAETAVGKGLVAELSALTLADVAASDDLTGHESFGGDWKLEFDVGNVESGIALSTEAQAQWSAVLAAPADDDFAYPTGNLGGNGGGSGWTGTWSGTRTQVVPTSLTHPTGGLETSGGAVQLNAPMFHIPSLEGRDLASPLGGVDETVWASFLLQPDETSDPDFGYMGLVFGTGGIGNTDQLFVGYSGTDFKMNNWGGSGVNVSTPGAVSGETAFIVMKLELSASGADTATLYVNPTSGVVTPDTPPSAVKSDLDLGVFSTVSIGGGRDGTNDALLDQIRIGNSFAEVAPATTNAPTAADNTVTTDEDVDYVFTAVDFNFADADAGDMLRQVEITTLPANGTLSLSGVDVVANQSISVDDIDAGNLVFTPASDQNGAAYDSFDFKVSDGVTAGPLGTELHSFAAPTINSMSGVAHDGTNIWLGVQSADTIYQLDSNGNQLSSFAAPGTSPTGIAFDGSNLWIISRDNDMVYEVDTSGNVLSSFATPGTDSRGLTWDGTSLWLVEGNGSLIYELSTTGTVLSSFGWPSDYMRDITWDGNSLWVSDQNDQLIRELNTSGTELSSFAAPSTGAAGLAYDGNEFWHADADTDTIYQIASTNSVTYSAAAYTMTIDVNAALDNSIPATQVTDEDTPLVLSSSNGNLVSVTEAGDPVEVTLNVSNGTVTLSNTIGPEFQANTETLDSQVEPVIAVAPDDSYVVVWTSKDQDDLDGKTGVYFQQFAADGTALGVETLVNQNTPDDQETPAIAMDAAGNFVITWASKAQDNLDGSNGVYGRLFNANGSAAGNEFLVTQTTLEHQAAPSVAMDDAGNFVVAWESKGQDDVDGDYGIFVRLFDAAGNPTSVEIPVNETTADEQRAPSVAMDADGDFVVAWQSKGQDDIDGKKGIYARQFNAVGIAQTSEFLVNQTTAGDQVTPSVAIDDAGNFVIAWESKGQDFIDGKKGIVARLYDNTATALGNEFVVNTTLVGDQTLPTVAMSGSGEFVIAWESKNQDNPDGKVGIVAQYYDAAGLAQGNEFIVNQTTALDQKAPSIGLNSDGEAIAVWQSKGQDNLDGKEGIFGQQFLAPDVLTFVTGDGIDDGLVTFSGTLADVNDALDGMVFAPTADFYGTASIQVDSNDGTFSDSDSFDITVNPVNDAPSHSIPGPQATVESVALTFSSGNGNAIAIVDDAGLGAVKVTLTATNGDISLSGVTGLSFTDGDGTNDPSMEFTGTLADVNAALEGLTFTPLSGFAGDAYLRIVTDDQGNTGGGALIDSDTISIAVSADATNDAPVNVLPAAPATPQDIDLVFSQDNGNPVSIIDDADDNPVHLTLGVTNGTLTLSPQINAETLVNTNTVDDQFNSQVAAAANGSYVVVWEGKVQDDPDGKTGIFAQQYNPLGEPEGAEFQVNTFTAGDQKEAAVAMNDSGAFVIVWQSANQDGDGTGIYGQLFDTGGNRVGGEFEVNTTITDNQATPDVAIDDAGNFVVTWASKGQDNLDGKNGVYAQRYDATGLALGDEFQVNSETLDDQLAPSIAMDSDGDFVIVWQGKGQDNVDGRDGIYGQLFNAAGIAQGLEFRVNSETLDDQQAPDVAMDDAGNFVVVWQSKDQDGDRDGIYAQLFAANGSAQGLEFQVNSATLDDQSTPAVAMQDTGEFVVTWSSKGQDNVDGKTGVYIQRYDASGAVQGIETLVNTTTLDDQQLPSVALDPDGNAIVTWTSSGQDNVDGRDGVYLQVLTGADAITYLTGDGVDDSLIELTGTTAQINELLDGMIFTPAVGYNGIAKITITTDDQGGSGSGGALSDTDMLNITVGTGNQPPAITSDGGGPTASINVAENKTLVTTVSANDPNLDPLLYSISGGIDQGLFSIDSNSGILTFNDPPDFELPTDNNGDNVYVVEVTVDDGNGGTDTQTLSVTVTDASEVTTAVDDAFNVGEDAAFNSDTDWFDNNWLYSRTLSFDNATRAENLTDFPVLIRLDSSRIDYTKTHDQGDDLRFVDQNGNQLAHEIEVWNEAGTSFVWVKVPQISANSTTDSILMYYGNAGVVGNGQDSAGVWTDYRATYHLNEDLGGAGTVADAAGNFDAVNSSSVDTAGYIGNGQDFNGVDQHINLGDDRDWINNATASTLSIWMNADTTAGSGDLIGLTRNDPADTGASRITLIRNGDDIQLIARTMDDSSDSISVVTTTNPLSAGQWHHVSGTIDYASDVNNIKIYVDGQLEGTFSHNFTNNAIPNTDSSHATIGSDEDGVSSFFDGQLDEARVASTLRSADWISAQYASMSDNFVSYGFEQSAHGVLANDIDLEGDSLSVTQVNGAGGAVGVPTVLPSGAILTMNSDGSFVYDPNGVFESLDVGESALDSFTYQIGDGFNNFDTATVTVTIDGAEDAAVIGGTAAGTVAEDGTLTATDTLTITDADTSDNPVSFNDVASTLGDNGYGNFEITSNTWTYTLNNGHAAVQALDVGETLNDTFTFTASDGSTQVVTVTINGAEDAAVIGGTAAGTVAEDGTLTATDTLTITDTDTSDNPISFNDVAATLGDNGYGDFEITSNTWTYTLNNGHASVQALDVGETLNDTFTFTASDGSTQVVTVTINGAEDAAVIGGTATGTVAEDGTLSATDTLTITDADTSDNPVSFNDVAATLGDNGYGDFEITSNTWTYTLNNGHAAVQALDVGESLNDTFTFTASDGSTQVVTVTINGAEDAPVIGGTATGAVAEDGTLTATNTLTITDADTSDNPVSFNDVAATLGDNGYGDFEITSNTWTYTLNNGHASVQALDVGETLNDTFTFTASDGSTQIVTVTINGAEDAPVIGGTATGAVAEDGTLTATDTLTITDADTSDNPVSFNDVASTLGDNGYGDFEITSNTWTYTLNNGHAAVQALDVGETLNDTFTFTASDGSTQVVTVTINGAEDAPVIGGTAAGTVAEDGTLTATDTLTITDTDTSDNPISFNDVAATLGDNGYGDFEITSNTWTYTLNNGHASVQALDVGETLNDTFTFTASDGSTQVVTVTINGAEDAAIIGGTATGTVAEDGTLSATDTLTITDADTSDNPVSFNDVAATLGDNGYGDFEITSNTWTYTLNNGHAAVQALDVGESLNDTFTFTASDGSTQVVTVTINGAEDAAVIGGTATGSVAEDGTLTATDTLTITDADTSDNPVSFNDVAPTLGDNGYGDFENTSNTWTYTLNNGHAAVQALDVGETLNDTFTFTASDGSTQVVTVTINGAEDAAVIGGTAAGIVSEDGTLTATDTLTITDTDTSDNPVSFNDVSASLGDNGYGNFEITSNIWTYTLNNGHAAVQALDVGETLNDTFTFTASDGSTQVVTVTINGAEDAAVIGGTATGSVAEDGTLTATDTLTITDTDTSDNPISFNDVAATLGDNGYGDFEITSNTWTYTLNNGHAAVQELDVGETLTDTYTFTATDGSTQTVTVTINGAEDAPVIGGVATGTVAEDGTLTASDTLTITDTDTSDNPISFNDVAASLGDNGYGNFEITSNTWTYTLNNGHASVQALDVGETLNDTYTFTASDGSTQVVTVTINGAEDTPVIGGTAVGSVAEDGTLTATDTLTITDTDTSDNPISFNDVAATLGDNGYGDFEITSNTWTYTLNNGNAAVQALDVGETLNDTFTFTASDGSTQIVTVTINGAEDAAVIGGTAVGSVAEDGTLTATDTLTITDTDTSDNPISFNDVAATLGDNGYGNFEITSNTWTYTLNNGHASVQALDVGETLNDTFTFTASDGSTQVVTVTINGAEDAAVIGGIATGAVAEDGTLTATDTLTITDVDTSDNPTSFNDVAATLGDNGYGNFEITSNTWTYTLNNGHASVQALDVGETLNDTFTFTASDGSTQVVTVTINGAEDGSVIGGTAAGTVAEDGTLTATDTLTITDADTSDNPISFNDVAATLGDNGYGNFEITSNTWTYTLNNGLAAVQALDVGETLTDTYTFTATDGSTQVVTITINGAEDAPVFDTTAITSAMEDTPYSYAITTSDVDVEAVTITAPTLPAWLTFVDNGNGTASLSGTPSNAEVGSHNVVLNVSDGTLSSNQNFTIVVANTNDPAVIGGVDTGAVQEDVGVVANNISTTGTLTISDPDTGESTFQAATINGTYGDLVMQTNGDWTYTADNTQAAIQQLDVTEFITDTLTVTSFDGTTHNVVITINGSEDAAVISGTTTGSVTEDGTLTSSGALTISDTDTSDTPSFADVGVTAGDNGYGTFEMTSGTWTYTLDNNNAAVQALDVSETLTDTHTFTASDGSTQQVTITINGAEDTPVFDSTAITAATEDVAYSYTITTSDVDVEAVTITAPTLPAWLTFVDNGNGTASLSGTPSNAEVGSHNVVLNVSDGTLSSNQNFTITVANTNDPAVIGGTDTGSVQEDVAVVTNNISTTGTLTIADPDTGESTFQAATINGTYGDLVMQTNGDWTYTADNTQVAIQQLDVTEFITDTLTVTSFDGTTHNVVITINGSEDAAVISGTTTGSVTEDGTLTSSGALTISDADTSDTPSFADVGVTAGDNGYGTFEMTSGTWTYTLDNNNAAVQALDVSETLTDTHTFTASDGSTQQVTITINGAEDTPVFDSTAITAATEDVAYSYTITTSDVDVEAVTITAPTLPAWLTFVDNGNGTASLSGTPSNAEVGSHNVVLNVSDGTLSSNQNFTITVANTNDPAVIGGVDTGAVQEDVAVVTNNISTGGLLTITDPDTGESTFQAGTAVGTYGSLTIDTAGNWTYTADNTQAAIQQLDVTEFITDTLTVTSFDGTTHNVVITINGSEDAAVISGTTTGSVTEDGTLTSSGALTISDADTSDTPSFADVGVTAGDNGYGTFEMTSGTWTYTLDNNNAAVQALDVSETLTDTHTFTASDGSTQQVTITINGAEDTPVFDSTAITAATEDVAYSYTITTSDVDVEAVTITAPTLPAWLTFVDNGNGTASLSGTPSNAEVGSHNVVLNVSDGTLSSNQNFTITVANTNDPAVIGGTDTGSVQEDVAVVTNNISTTGTLTISDPDTGESTFQAATINGTYGDLVMQTNGDWTYTADNTQVAIQQLDVTEFITDTLTVTSFDGTTHGVVITINGSEDAAVIGGVAIGAVTEDGALIASDTLGITDVDTNDNPISFNDVAPTLGINGYGTFEITANTWNYTLNNSHAAVQALGSGGALNDIFTFVATDGSTRVVTVTINGANDAPVIVGTSTGAVAEDVAVTAGNLVDSGSLAIADPDTGESGFMATTINGTYGNLTIDSAGNWSYRADNSQSSIQSLQAGESVTDTLTVTTVDGSTQDVVITIIGARDAAPPPVDEPPDNEPPPEDEPPVDEPPDEGEEEQGGTGDDPILEEIVQVPQGTSPPVTEEDSSFVQPDEAESEPVDYGSVIDKQTAKIPEQPQPPAVNPQSLNIDALTLQVSDDEALNEQHELELLNRIDSMHRGMDSETSEQNADDVNVQIIVGSTASLTVGIVSWVLRGGALLASFMSTVPLLNRFDPLPILKAREDEDDVEPDDDDDEKTQVRDHARKVDNMFSGKGDSQQ